LNEALAPSPRRICLGRITGVHGIKGEVKALAGVDDLETLEAVRELELDAVPYQILAVRFQKSSLIMSLANVQTREQAEKLVGKDIWIDPLRLPKLPAGEYYWFEILGLSVFRADTGGYVGKIKAVMPTPAHDVYVVEEEEVEYLIPAVAEVILSIDPDQGRILIAPEGLAAQSGAY
jgi:16S rRNA processing protein RimM